MAVETRRGGMLFLGCVVLLVVILLASLIALAVAVTRMRMEASVPPPTAGVTVVAAQPSPAAATATATATSAPTVTLTVAPAATPAASPTPTQAPTATPAPTASAPEAPVEPTATATPRPAPTRPPRTDIPGVIYTVKRGDVLVRIATCFGLTVPDLLAVNDIPNPGHIEGGQQILIPRTDVDVTTCAPAATPVPAPTATPRPAPTSPPRTDTPGVIYTVKRGDVLVRIATCFGLTVPDLLAVNDIPNPGHIEGGQQILIPRTDVDVTTCAPAATPVPTAPAAGELPWWVVIPATPAPTTPAPAATATPAAPTAPLFDYYVKNRPAPVLQAQPGTDAYIVFGVLTDAQGNELQGVLMEAGTNGGTNYFTTETGSGLAPKSPGYYEFYLTRGDFYVRPVEGGGRTSQTAYVNTDFPNFEGIGRIEINWIRVR